MSSDADVEGLPPLDDPPESLPAEPNRMNYLAGVHGDPPDTPPRLTLTTPYVPPVLFPVLAAFWTTPLAPPCSVLVEHPDGGAWTPMWAIDGPNEHGDIQVSASGELQQRHVATDRLRWGMRAWWAPRDAVWILSPEHSDYQPQRAVGPPTVPTPRRLRPVFKEDGYLLGRTAWTYQEGDGWVEAVLASELYTDELPLTVQIARGLSADDPTTDLYINIMATGHWINWQLEGETRPTQRYLAGHLWI